MSGPRVLGARTWSWRQLVREAGGDEDLAIQRLADMPGYGEYQHETYERREFSEECPAGHTGRWVVNAQGNRICRACANDSQRRYRDGRRAAA